MLMSDVENIRDMRRSERDALSEFDFMLADTPLRMPGLSMQLYGC